MKIKYKILFNFIGFYICWWLTIFGAISKIYCIGPIVTIIFIILHLYKVANHRKEDIFLLISFLLECLLKPSYLILKLLFIKEFL